MKATAIKKSGAAETRFSVSAESPERLEELVAAVGGELVEDGLGHEGHQPLPESRYSAAAWESEGSLWMTA